ncbi:mechanosensitive ion channel family protein [Microbacterium lacticum]|uniref:Small conductance mechanosensitive channel n=1 Tax=Microbacterium lacticum TaxID=33885 RepID=A0A4Y3UMM9_9MICO|nr:small conductance mechanosensitive channel [Microbacterium lacticum]GEB94749.1 mechanosensitive ion channel protein MscS [Microbacterium lacticum]GGN19032.1 mechanosensitive ion channel protein MscS [Microbacterium lacticum]
MIWRTDLHPGETPAIADPDLWQKILTWLGEAGMKLLAVALIIVGAILASWVLRLVIRRVVDRIVSGAKTKANVDDTQALERSPLAAMRLVQRTRTLGSILQNIVNVTLVIIAVLQIISVLAPGVAGSFALLSAAIGAGLGFGAQNIVKDVLNGIFIVAEDQVGIGDVVDLGLATGVVEYVSVRVTHVRDVNGTLWYVRNGEITRIGNMSQGWSRVILDLAVPADVDIDEVEKTMLGAAKSLAKDPKWRTRIIEQPEIWGLESITGDALVIRLVMKTRANAKDDVARELRMRLKRAVDDLGIELPSLNTVVLAGLEGAQRVRGANPPRTRPTPVTTVDDASAATPRATKTPRGAKGKAETPSGTPEAEPTDGRAIWRPRKDGSPGSGDAPAQDDAPATSSEASAAPPAKPDTDAKGASS